MKSEDTAHSAAEGTALVSSYRRGGDAPSPALPAPTERKRQFYRHTGRPSLPQTKTAALLSFPVADTASSIPHG